MAAELTAGTWTLDATHTAVGFVVRHAGISKVRGGFHDVDAKLVVGNDIQIEAVAKVDSVDTGVADRDAHLKSGEFFDAEQFPEMTIKTTSVQIDGEKLTIVADLTIKGNTKSVEFTGDFGGVATDPFGTTRTGLSASTTISRKEFGITWNAVLEAGGVMVSDKVVINLEAEFVAPGSK